MINVGNRLVQTLWILSLLVFSVSAAADIKVGFVSSPKILENAPQGKAAMVKLQEEFAQKEKELNALNESILKMEEDYKKNNLIMSESERLQKEKNIRADKRKLKRLSQEHQEDFTVRRNEELRKLQKVIRAAIEKLAKERGYDLIVEQAVYFNESIDLTDEIIEKLSVSE